MASVGQGEGDGGDNTNLNTIVEVMQDYSLD